MKVFSTALDGVLIIEPSVFPDNRGFFMETYNRDRYKAEGIETDFVQDNFSYSVQGTLRGLHYQFPHSQAKLVQVLDGAIFDVAVDIRRGSSTFGQWTGAQLSGENKRQFLIPEGFAHGFAVLSKTAMFTYKCSDFYSPECEKGVIWNDPDIGIEWPVTQPILSDRDKKLLFLKNIDQEYLPIVEGPK
ncbi:MAG: dTDP-4-dehydrorhamnose 3,5-epimerase [Deltaproteobacteria bacterium]|nr:dTDP-4-dehydrorhamnose 3,5-epimerase [Deltaproteobacteria bacterium]